jgi:regulator of RNase E activity RraA
VLGDRLAGQAAANGWAGIIVHGCVRDTAQLAGMDVGIKALAPCPVKSSKRDPGLKAVSRRCSGLLWQCGACAHVHGAHIKQGRMLTWLSLPALADPQPGVCAAVCRVACVQVRVIIGGVQIRPGDWIYADEDGVLVSRDELQA